MKDMAEESLFIEKKRKKLKFFFREIDKKVTRKALKEKAEEIKNRVDRNVKSRIIVSKELCLFDANKNSAKVSKIVNEICRRLKKT